MYDTAGGNQIKRHAGRTRRKSEESRQRAGRIRLGPVFCRLRSFWPLFAPENGLCRPVDQDADGNEQPAARAPVGGGGATGEQVVCGQRSRGRDLRVLRDEQGDEQCDEQCDDGRVAEQKGKGARTRSSAGAISNMYHRAQRLLLATLLGSTAALIAAQGDSILDIVKSKEDFSTLALIVEAAGLDGVLDDDDISITVFAPPNSAFDDLPQELVAKLLDPDWQPQLQDVLLYHTLTSAVFSADLMDGKAPTANVRRDSVIITTSPSITINDANVIAEPPSFDIPASNGGTYGRLGCSHGDVPLSSHRPSFSFSSVSLHIVVHVIDAVLTPPSISRDVVDTAMADNRLGTLVTAWGGLAGTLMSDGPFTVFGTWCGDADTAFERISC